MKENRNTSITFRTTAQLKQKLENMAEQDNRSLSDYIHLTLSELAKKAK
jgi:predicted HicB family RNase H-like nuclease